MRVRAPNQPNNFSQLDLEADLLRNPCILGGSQHQARGEHQNWPPAPAPAPAPAFSGAQKNAGLQRNPYFSGVPNAKRGEKIRIGYLTPAFSGAQKRADLLCNPCILGSPTPSAGRKSELAASSLLSQGPKRGRTCYVTPAFLGGPQRQAQGENQKWPFAFLGVHSR